ncbi:hypothetical protein QBC44DRAFT_231340 [Cladorrhinum sp. PSN332]|nr:hypothetical protein QBC44DRAFT_231340 [Cladorrhinum sp. PSN332]
MLFVNSASLLLGACFVGFCAAGDAGDDFANNLFTDLAPLLALFGERVTMQFMSQSTGWADNIVLAMAPLGIVTAIVGAIRVGGPSFLKAIIGRARESRAVAEAELMSSTSKEVSELWNGQEIVRVMGSGPIREFVVLMPDGDGGGEGIRVMDVRDPENDKAKYLREYGQFTPARLPALPQPARYPPVYPERNGDASAEISGNSDDRQPSTVVIRNGEAESPNLTLNTDNRVGRRGTYAAATVGVLLQAVVLVYAGFAQYHPELRVKLPKEDGIIPANTVLLMLFGTVVLVAGMAICAYVVESSTSEKRYRPGVGRKAYIVWLQRSGTVSDQTFESFAVMPKKSQTLVTTSQRCEPGKREILRMKFVAFAGTVIALGGFVVQFIGLRGMHFSVSIAQLGAIGIMTIARAIIRRNLAKGLHSVRLVSGHELDWLATNLGKDEKPTSCPNEKATSCPKPPWYQASAPCDSGWQVSSIIDPKAPAYQGLKPAVANQARGKAHEVMRIRKELGRVAGWVGRASVEAVALARCIEIAMDTLLSDETGEFTWSFVVNQEEVHLRVSRGKGGSWKAYSDELESVLSLWLYSVCQREDGKENNEAVPSSTDDDSWLRSKGTASKPSLRLLGSYTKALQRDLEWWLPDGGASVIQVEAHRVTGFSSNALSCPRLKADLVQYRRKPPTIPSDDTPLATELFTSLKTQYAQHMLSVFISAAARAMKHPIENEADVRLAQRDNTSNDGSAWESISLHSVWLSKMAQDMHATELGSLDEIYLALIPPLSLANKLPQSDAIISWAREQARLHEERGRWTEAGHVYLWLYWTGESFPPQHPIALKATALLMEFLREISEAVDLCRAQDLKLEVYGLEYLREEVSQNLSRAHDRDKMLLPGLMGLLKLQGRSWQCDLVEEPLPTTDEPIYRNLGVGILHQLSIKEANAVTLGRNLALINNGENPLRAHVSMGDIFDWTALHYAAAEGAPENVTTLANAGAALDSKDTRGRAPLHYACLRANNNEVVLNLTRGGAALNARDTNGMTAVHFASLHGNLDTVRLLAEAGADMDLADNSGTSPLLWAAFRGHADVVKELCKDSNTTRVDHMGRTALHLAVLGVINLKNDKSNLLEIVDTLEGKINMEVHDKEGLTALHIAVKHGHQPIAELLVDKGANLNSKTSYGVSTSLHAAANASRKNHVKLLLEAGGRSVMNKQDSDGNTPLHYATRRYTRYTKDIVGLLLEYGADRNITNQDGKTALDLAIRWEKTGVAKMLRQGS